MTSKSSLGVWIAGIGAITVFAAVIAGFLSVGSPGDARAQRLDDARLMTMHQIAAAAQCAFAFTNKVPASLDEIHRAFVERRAAVAVGVCNYVEIRPDEESAISYQANDSEHIMLCGAFRRPSPPWTGAD